MDIQTTSGITGRATKNVFAGLSDEMQLCIQNCVQCHQVCEQMISHCLSQGGAHSAPGHIRTLQDCAEICAASADFMIRASPLHAQTCGVCASACLACAAACEKFQDDEVMQTCAEVCRQCASSCQKMASHH